MVVVLTILDRFCLSCLYISDAGSGGVRVVLWCGLRSRNALLLLLLANNIGVGRLAIVDLSIGAGH